MNKSFLFSIFTAALLSTGITRAHAQSSSHLKGWKLEWSDEFNHDGLPDSSKWDYETGFVRNHEQQYYTHARPENARVENGTLILEGRRERFPNKNYRPGSGDWREAADSASYTSACLVTLHKASWKYGRIEVRAKLPQGQGVWPAIWMLGANEPKVGWPRCGEIDIMEFIGRDSSHIYGTVHFADGKGGHRSNGGKITVNQPYNDFHIYAVEWTPKQMDFYYDKQLYHSFPLDTAGAGSTNPFRKPQYLLLNLALGGSWGGPVEDIILPQRLLIDYVRIYRK